ncbi:MAG: DNA-formamidopyrimidine glycosylase family protein [Acidimicrobiia bacterium]|nr:DNA-formamidopyrimidine glycosylase family protein [Acidimicrobiia bacterium]
MPELPDVAIYVERLAALFGGRPLTRLRIGGPFVLKSVDPPPDEFEGRRLEGVERLGKRIVMAFEGEHFAVVHLMVAGRLRLRDPGATIPRKRGLAAFDFPDGTVLFTEEGTRKRASLHLERGRDAVAAHDRGGIEPLEMSREDLAHVLAAERHTLKRSLTDPRLVSGIGGAYADEIMHRAGVGPLTLTDRLDDDEIDRLHAAIGDVLTEWVDRLRDEVGDGFPEKVTAFHPEMAVHGRFGEPCPVCGAPVQRIRYASNETNYCAGCQTGGRILADRALSRLLKDDFPRDLADLE